MMNRLFKRGMVIALAAAMTTSAGIPAMAAQKETLEETVPTSEAVSYTHLTIGMDTHVNLCPLSGYIFSSLFITDGSIIIRSGKNLSLIHI